MDLKFWLTEQGLSVRELALQLEAPLKTVEDWVYRGAAPSAKNKERLVEFIGLACTHHWVIESANGPSSGGVCQRCGETREFKNSAEVIPWQSANQHNKTS
jgi:hypothetical protein